MKKRLFLLLSSLAVTLTSCSFLLDLFDDYELDSNRVSFYKESESDDTLLERQGSLDILYHPGEELIYYVDLQSYMDMLSCHFKSTVSFRYDEDKQTYFVQAYDRNNYIFYAIIYHATKEIYYGGSLYSALPSNSEFISNSSLGYGANVYEEYTEDGHSYYAYDYGSMSATSHYANGKIYLPLGLWDMTIGQTCGIAHVVTPSGIVAYDNISKIYSYRIVNGIYETNPISLLNQQYRGVMPSYLRQHEYECLCTFMDNHYGFKKDLGITSFDSFYHKKGYDLLMNSSDAKYRMQGFSTALAIFGDMHTRLLNNAAVWGESSEGYTISDVESNHDDLRRQLSASRDEHFVAHNLDMESIEYSSDNKTALFRFDSFSACADAFDADGIKAYAYKEDTFLYVMHQLDAILSHGGVKNVVLDISLNGGGYVLEMLKILALLGDMKSHVYTYSDFRGFMVREDVNLETENLGIEKTRYADLDFYILTSPVSFSCGNALPCLARHQGIAKTIGVNSGGGECTVETVFTPGTHYFCYSSDNRMVDVNDDGTIYHLENGAGIDIALEYKDFFKIEEIAAKLH